MLNLIKEIENKQIKIKKIFFRTGDLVEVKLWIIENNKKRLQVFEGIVISIRNRGLNSSFTVRKISHGEGVERIFKINSLVINNIIIKRKGNVRLAKLYYLRKYFGKNIRKKHINKLN